MTRGFFRLPAPLVIGVLALVSVPIVAMLADALIDGVMDPSRLRVDAHFLVQRLRWAIAVPSTCAMAIGLVTWRERARPETRALVTIALVAVTLGALLPLAEMGLLWASDLRDYAVLQRRLGALVRCERGAWTLAWLALAATGVVAARGPRTLVALVAVALAWLFAWIAPVVGVSLGLPAQLVVWGAIAPGALVVALDRAGGTVANPPAFGERVVMRAGMVRIGGWLIALAVAAYTMTALALIVAWGPPDEPPWHALIGPGLLAGVEVTAVAVLAAIASRATFPGAPARRMATAALGLGGAPSLALLWTPAAPRAIALIERGASALMVIGSLALLASAARALALAEDRPEHARHGAWWSALVAIAGGAGVALSFATLEGPALAAVAGCAFTAGAGIHGIAVACRRAGGRVPLPRRS